MGTIQKDEIQHKIYFVQRFSPGYLFLSKSSVHASLPPCLLFSVAQDDVPQVDQDASIIGHHTRIIFLEKRFLIHT